MMNKISQEELYEKFKPKVEGYVFGKISDRNDAEDIVSEIFLKILRSIHTYDEEKASLSTWIYTITQNTVVDYFRSKRNEISLPDEVIDDYITEPEIFDDTLDSLSDALEHLPECERDLIILHYYNGFTLKKIGGMMNKSYITVKVMHRRALNNIRRLMCPKN